ncbi:hypothetical protein [Streptomyces sp. NPDC014733]|uniref:hypothetical protein n=1 Tax=Streptomyces sp. NPDC014733 TaxID=3364885 RepID=UPI0037027BAF
MAVDGARSIAEFLDLIRARASMMSSGSSYTENHPCGRGEQQQWDIWQGAPTA